MSHFPAIFDFSKFYERFLIDFRFRQYVAYINARIFFHPDKSARDSRVISLLSIRGDSNAASLPAVTAIQRRNKWEMG